MFSSALKSFSSNISSNYTLAPNPTSTCGPWKIFDGRKKSSGKSVSIFVFERKSLEGGTSLRSGGASLKQAHDEVVERLKKEASSLARLRHPSVLELAEPVEETRYGGLTFATEPITASLSGLLEEKDEQEKAGGVRGQTSKYVVDDPAGGGKRRREVEIDELEIQKGLLQVAKGLEFLHESARLVHANLTPDAIFINAKSDWKISGLGFSCPLEASSSNSTGSSLQLSEVLNYDNRLPKSVQLNLDYSSPDFVIDNNVTASADMFSLGLIIIALYNSPHRTPLETSFSVSTYKRLLSAATTTPTQRNNYLCKQSIPRDVLNSLLPRLITRRPANRMTAREFQQTQYFDSILVSTLRFLDNLPAKTFQEKSQFMRGLPRIMAQFPKSVLEKKILAALLEEMKDHDLLSQILENVFKIIEMVPNSKRAFSESVVPKLREVFLATTSTGRSKVQERDTSKEGGLLVILDNMTTVASHCTGKEFKEDILPMVYLGLDSPTHSVQDAALQTMMTILPVLDFSTIKNELFPAVSHVFSKTSSLAIKVKGLEALNVLCGGESDEFGASGDNLMAAKPQSKSSSSCLDKYTVQEKVVPLLKAIKTKEPAVMMSALKVFTQVGKVADETFLALEAIPCLWQFSLGPLLTLEQFQQFISLIKTLSTRVEEEHSRKLQQLSTTGKSGSTWSKPINGAADDGDFETLVTGRKTNGNSDSWDASWDHEPTTQTSIIQSQRANPTPTFSWSTPSSNPSQPIQSSMKTQVPRTITPDTTMSSFAALQPSSRTNSGVSSPQPMQQQSSPAAGLAAMASGQSNFSNSGGMTANWSNLSGGATSWSSSALPQSHSTTSNPWSNMSNSTQQNQWSGQTSNLANSFGGITIAPPPSGSNQNSGGGGFGQSPKSGLDKYDSLI